MKRFAVICVGVLALGCGGSKEPPKDPSSAELGVGADPMSSSEFRATHKQKATSGGAGSAAGGEAPEKAPEANACVGFDFDLVAYLSKAACEVAKDSAGGPPLDPAKRLEVKVVPSSVRVAPGGRVDITLLYKNKGDVPLPLTFAVNPLPDFVIEAYDTKGKRVDLPAGKPPPIPSSIVRPGDPAVTAARVTLAPHGTGKVTLGWDAVRTKWAPEKLKGAVGSAYPRAPAGPLSPAKYVLKIITPLTGVMEGFDREVSVQKLEIEVTR